MLVFDEADRMLTDESFKQDLQVILNKLPKQRQTLLFSASMIKNYYQVLGKELILGT